MEEAEHAPSSEHDAPGSIPSWRSTSRPVAPRTPRERAEHRIAELLRAYGLTSLTHLGRVIDRLLGGRTLETEEDVADAVREARETLRGWLASVLGEDGASAASPERVRALLARHPDVLLSDDVDADWLRRELALERPASSPRLRPQPLRVNGPRWLLGLVPSFVLAALAVWWLAPALARNGWSVLDLSLAILLAVLAAHSGIAVTLSWLGLVRQATRRTVPRPAAAVRGRTAIVVAIYHEDTERVFSGIAAMRESLAAADARGFEIFVLSDTQRAEIAAAEERAVRRLRAGQPGSPIPLYYRRRANNAGYKSGNLADFFVRWGDAYDYVVVLDADSLVEGETLVELARRMDEDPQLGLLQLPIEPVRATTAFARLLQLGAQLYGPLFTEGLAAWSGDAGNYYGHNAIVRVRAFVDSCGLPELSGEPPFGGLILSHDFVEAALLRRAGWKVRIASDLGGSYEELPPTLDDYVARDRRWAQGNLQHLRVAAAEGLAPMSRLHLLLGALGYLAAPLWLAFVVLFGLSGLSLEEHRVLVLVGGAATVLLLPKVAGWLDAMARPARRRAFGGALSLGASWIVELLASAVLAPILMMHHVAILARILVGGAVGWKPQRRRASGESVLGSLRRHAWLPLGGLALAAASALWFEGGALWLSAIWAPLVAAPLVSALGASERLGGALARIGLLRVPTETDPPAVVDRTDDLRALCLDDSVSRFRDLVLDPVLNELHCRSLERSTEVSPRLVARALRIGPAALDAADRAALLASAPAMRQLHREAWTTWPIEAWLVDRSTELAPPEARTDQVPKRNGTSG